MNNAGEKHIQEPATNLTAAVRSRAARELHLRNRLAAKGALRQMSSNVLAAKHTAALIRDRPCYCTHTASHTSLPRLGSRPWNRQGTPYGRVNPCFENEAKQFDKTSKSRLEPS